MRKVKGVFIGGRQRDPSSKYGLNPDKIITDAIANAKKHNHYLYRVKSSLVELIQSTPDHRDNFSTLCMALREIKQELDL